MTCFPEIHSVCVRAHARVFERTILGSWFLPLPFVSLAPTVSVL